MALTDKRENRFSHLGRIPDRGARLCGNRFLSGFPMRKSVNAVIDTPPIGGVYTARTDFSSGTLARGRARMHTRTHARARGMPNPSKKNA